MNGWIFPQNCMMMRLRVSSPTVIIPLSKRVMRCFLVQDGEVMGKCLNLDRASSMCAKQAMAAGGMGWLSKGGVYPHHLEAHRDFAAEVRKVSLRTEHGVLTMYAVSERVNPYRVPILETYSSKEAYGSHTASEHFQKYKQGTLHMVKPLILADQIPLNPANTLNNFIQ